MTRVRGFLSAFLRSAALVLLFAASVWGQGDAATPADRVIFLVRHAEKCTVQERDPALSAAGERRALALARTLQNVDLDAIYSTPFTRTRETARPVADAQELEVIETPVEEGFLEDLAAELRSGDARAVLVCGHSNTIPPLVNLLAGTDYPHLRDDVYDKLFVVTLEADGTARVLELRYGEPSSTEPGC